MTSDLNPVIAAALAPLFERPRAQNWVMLDASGAAIWIVYAEGKAGALAAYPWAADARLETESAEDIALGRYVRSTWGSCS